MEVFKNINDIGFNRDTLITIGTFDGVHKGHQSILTRLNEISATKGLRNVVITFDPHPQIVLNRDKDHPVRLLTTVEERLSLFEKANVQNVLILPFTKEFSTTSPEDFVREYLVERIGLKKMLVGYDHLFGRNREGNQQLLSELGKEYDFELESVSAFEDDLIIVSSTKIRKMLCGGNLDGANTALGYNYSYCGKVVIGDRRGHTIGYPTANIKADDEYKLLPANGVYLVKGVIDGKNHYGMANIGIRPTFTNEKEPILEVYFFDFNGDLYDQNIRISFLKYIREEKKFAGLEEFLEQLKNDEINCRNLINEFYY